MADFISKTFGRLCCGCCPRKSDCNENKSLIEEEETSEADGGAIGGSESGSGLAGDETLEASILESMIFSSIFITFFKGLFT